jgi:hypothetical protein
MFESSAREEYLRRAEEAEKEERRAKDLHAKEAWERIVVGYLELAEMARREVGRSFAKLTLDHAPKH